MDWNGPWLAPALDYVQDWLAFQVERFQQPGCVVAIARGNSLIGEYAFGHADLRTGKRMSRRHRFRIASHSKTFTAAAVLLLREEGRLGLDDPIGRYVDSLHPDVARARVAELLSHGAGITRDGDDAGQFADRRPYLTRDEVLEDLRRPQPLEPGVQLKYSNHGYALLGMMIEQVTGTPYADWMTHNVIRPAGLRETVPDMPLLPRGAQLASGHTAEFPFGQRRIVPGDNATHAIAPAGGFVSTAADTARFFAQLDPECEESILSPASRRAMVQRRWRDEVSTLEQWYGLGTMMTAPGPKEWFGHTGGLQGFTSRTSRFTANGLTVTVLTNAQDGLAWVWADGIQSILAAFQQHGAPARRVASWRGDWWSVYGCSHLVPVGDKVFQVAPAMHPPFDALTVEIEVTGKDRGIIRRASAYNSPGQAVRLVRDGRGKAREFWAGGTKLLTRGAIVKEVTGRYRATVPGRARSTS
ncbi:class A beta-lactamase-related serine hydrolase [Ramlibacter henchirensis]|uniref:Class A beta-lactamase-related serine hydrolase n=1 Tax=Ramlibacter henchirensis TaxID=204072 RepID=A0A4Z0C4Q8_9BURK|nr:class A beta-lactamase-related serine hydrolase [Ramlibacter henchirensis]